MNKTFKIIIAIVAVILIGSAVVYWKNTTTVSDSAWKTYISKKYGFSFQYPSNWNVVSTYPESILLSSPETKRLLESKPHENMQNYDVSVTVYGGKPATQSDTYKITDTILDGKPIKKVWSVGPDSGPFESAMYQDNGIQVSFYPYPQDEIGTKIVTSFATSSVIQKTDNNVVASIDIKNVADWETYNDDHLGLSFKLPVEFRPQRVSAYMEGLGTDLSFAIGHDFLNAINATGTIQTNWSMEIGHAGTGCSLMNESPKGSVTSTKITQYQYIKLTEVYGYDHGAGSVSEIYNYVQPINGTSCRYISFRRDGASAGSITAQFSPEEASKILKTDARIDNTVKELIPLILNSIRSIN